MDKSQIKVPLRACVKKFFPKAKSLSTEYFLDEAIKIIQEQRAAIGFSDKSDGKWQNHSEFTPWRKGS